MFNEKKILAIIPARGGSKGLPRKNIKPLLGKPLIGWSIETALNSALLDYIIVSTDDDEIANTAKSYGVAVPFMRPAELASDNARGIDVVFHAMNWCEQHYDVFDLVMLLQPTSPLRQTKDIRGSLEIMFQKGTRAVVSVCESEHSPLWMNTITEDLSMNNFLSKEALNANRQTLKTYYRLNGVIYIADWNYLKETGSFVGEQTCAYIMPQERSIDIDSELDFKFSEFLLTQKDQEKGS